MARIRKDRKGGDNSFYSSRIVRNRREFEDNDANLNLETGIKKKTIIRKIPMKNVNSR